jgi:DNA-binding transcriptional MerR regulator
MGELLTIGAAARRAGVSVRAIRFYEAEGLLPPARRTAAGYRLYTRNDVRRLRLIRRARLLGVPLPEVRELVDRAFASACATYADDLLGFVARQRQAITCRIAELEALRDELDRLAAHVRRVRTQIPAGQTVAACGHCPMIDDAVERAQPCSCTERPALCEAGGSVGPPGSG